MAVKNVVAVSVSASHAFRYASRPFQDRLQLSSGDLLETC